MLVQGWDSESAGQHLVHFADQFAKMAGWEQTTWRSSADFESEFSANGGKAGMNMILDVRIEFRGAARQLDAVHTGITISVSSISHGSSRSSADRPTEKWSWR